MNSIEVRVNFEDVGLRLDKFLTLKLPDFSRSRLQSLIDDGHLNCSPSRRLTASTKVMLNDIYTLTIPELIEATPKPQEIALNIVYEDNDLIVINKPAGMVVHPAPGHSQDTLVNALLNHCGEDLSGIGGVKRPGIVHRLDKDTSGLMVVAKNDFTHNGLAAQFHDRQLSRTYICFVWGVPTPKNGTINTLIGRSPTNRQKMAVLNKNGRESITHYQVLNQFTTRDELSWISIVECRLATGRTHQIRVHMQHIGCPLIGDPLYGRSRKNTKSAWPISILNFPRQALHAKELKFIHPRTSQNLFFTCNLPIDLEEICKELENNQGIC